MCKFSSILTIYCVHIALLDVAPPTTGSWSMRSSDVTFSIHYHYPKREINYRHVFAYHSEFHVLVRDLFYFCLSAECVWQLFFWVNQGTLTRLWGSPKGEWCAHYFFVICGKYRVIEPISV